MFCKNCGHPMSEDARFCSNCGYDNKPVQPDVEEQKPVEEVFIETPIEEPKPDPIAERVKGDAAGGVLKLGILGVVFGIAVPYLNILGIIFSIIAKNKAAEFMRVFRVDDGRVRVGKILSTIGLIGGIAMTAIYFFAIIIGIIIGIAESL